MDLTERCYEKSPSVVGRSIEGEEILVPIGKDVGDLQNIYVLNQVGSFIWKCIDGKIKTEEIRAKIVDEFDVTPEEAERDLTDFLQQLEEVGAIVGAQ